MNGFLVRTLVTALALLVATLLVPGIRVSGLFTLLFAAVLFGVINAILRPTLQKFTVPLNGTLLLLALLVVNAAMLGITALLLPGMQVHGILAALVGAAVISAVGWAASRFIGADGRISTTDQGATSLPRRG